MRRASWKTLSGNKTAEVSSELDPGGGAEVRYLPAYSPASTRSRSVSKSRRLLRKAAARTVDGLIAQMARTLQGDQSRATIPSAGSP